VITAERGEGALTRHGLEEYVSDCVILLDHRVTDQVSTRRLRIVKYRGTAHGTNEYPFLIDEDGFSVLPVTSLGLQHRVSQEHISSGVPAAGYHVGRSRFLPRQHRPGLGNCGNRQNQSGRAVCRCACPPGGTLHLFFLRGIARATHAKHAVDRHRPRPVEQEKPASVHSSRATLFGLEMHLAIIHKIVHDFQPQIVVIDPVGSLIQAGNLRDAHTMLIRLIDFLKQREVTGFLTNLTSGGGIHRENRRGDLLHRGYLAVRSRH